MASIVGASPWRQASRAGRHGGLLFSALLLVLLGGGRSEAAIETPQFQTYGTADGLPSDTVYVLERGADGDLWIGTGDGLARFDGVEFELFQHRPDRADTLPSNVIQALHVDAAGRLWVGSEGGGLSMRAPGSSGFRHWRRGSTPGFELDDVWTIRSDADGAIWFGGFGGGLYRLRPDIGEMQVFRHDPTDPRSLSSDHVLALAIDATGTLWVGCSNGLNRWTGTDFERQPGTPGALVLSLTADADGGLWIGRVSGLDRRRADGVVEAAAQREGLGEPGVTALVRDGPDSLWIATRSGLFAWADGAPRRQLAAQMEQQGLRPGSVFDIERDHEGGLWFASVGRGLLRLPPGWRDFAVLRHSAERSDTLSAAAPRGIADAADGALWVVGKGGALDRVDAVDGQVQRSLAAADALPDRVLSAVLETADGAVWIGHQRGLSRYSPADGSTRHWLAGSEDGPPEGAVDQLIDDGTGGFWLSAYGGGIERRDGDGRLLQRITDSQPDGLPAVDTEQLLLGPDGALWVAGAHGLRRRDGDSGELRPLAGGPTERVHGLAFDADGRLWTHRLGALERWQVSDTGLHLEHRIDSAGGLPAVASGGVIVAADGAVWLTTRRGLWRYRPNSDPAVVGELRRYGLRDGLVSQEFADRPPRLTRAGLIAAGSLDGLVLFDPTRLHPAGPSPRLRLQSLEVIRDGERLALDPLLPVQLRHDDRELHAVVRLASFSAADSRRHRFRLLGFDPDWVETGSLGERSISRLPPGRFELQAEAAIVGGDWSGLPLPLQIEVAPPWWRTTSAHAALLVAALLAALGGWQLQRRRLARRHAAALAEAQRQSALQISEAKSRFLATLGHEIRTPMTGVLGMTELLLDAPLEPLQRSRAEAIQRSGELMLRLLNDLLDLARIEAGKLALLPAPFDLPALLGAIAAQQAALAERKGLRFDLVIDPTLPAWRLGDRLRLQQILLNLTGNAIKFTESGFVALRLKPVPVDCEIVELQVDDSGPGLAAAQRERLFRRFEQADGARTARTHGGSGLGLAISEELVAAMGGRILLDSAPGVGSCFRVQLRLPIVNAPVGADAPGRSAATAGVSVAAATGLGAAGRRLLLVEDDPVVAEVIVGLLAARGHVVVHVPHGLAALAELAAGEFELALLDLDLPGIDGLALARLLRAQGHGLPLLVVTARADADAELAARAAGCDGFLRKPVDGATLWAAVQRCIEAASA